MKRIHRSSFFPHVHMSVDAERDVRVLVAGELLHDTGMHALLGCEGQERVPELVQRVTLHAVVLAVVLPPVAQVVGC